MYYKRNPSVEIAPMQEETILYQPVLNKFCVLNSSAAFLWEQLSEPCTTAQLADAVCTHFEGIAPGDAAKDIEAALAELRSLELVVVNA